jgi:hypothetical protein
METRMTKAQLRKNMLPIVIIHFQDHSADLEGIAEPFKFAAIGVVLRSDKNGYTLGHWVPTDDNDGPDNYVTSYVAKVPGISVQTIGHFKVR